MKIISMSLDEKLLNEIDLLKDDLGFSSRSEVVRAGARLLLQDKKEKEKLVGHVHAVLVVVHNENFSHTLSTLRHKHEKIIKTQIHSDLDKEKCLQIFIIDGDAKQLKVFLREINKSKKAEFLKLIVS